MDVWHVNSTWLFPWTWIISHAFSSLEAHASYFSNSQLLPNVDPLGPYLVFHQSGFLSLDLCHTILACLKSLFQNLDLHVELANFHWAPWGPISTTRSLRWIILLLSYLNLSMSLTIMYGYHLGVLDLRLLNPYVDCPFISFGLGSRQVRVSPKLR